MKRIKSAFSINHYRPFVRQAGFGAGCARVEGPRQGLQTIDLVTHVPFGNKKGNIQYINPTN
jgi:hypothetical protein